MHLHHWAPTDLRSEAAYNVRAVRLPRFDGAAEPYAGGAWVVVADGTTMTEHVNPDGESELFYIVAGHGVLDVAGERRDVSFGDTVFIPPHEPHSLTNDGGEPLVFLSLWWGGRPAAATSSLDLAHDVPAGQHESSGASRRLET